MKSYSGRPKEDGVPSFWLDHRLWRAAVVEQNRDWDLHHRELADEMRGAFNDETLWKISRLYRTARNFREDQRHLVAKRIRDKIDDVKEGTRQAAFDSIVVLTRELSTYAKELEPIKLPRKVELEASPRKNSRPLSGISKIIWHRHPELGFIYDARALTAATRSGLLAPFHDLLSSWGGEPKDDGEADFLIFAASYRRYFLPLHEPIAEEIAKKKGDTRRASRIVDRLLWNRRNRRNGRPEVIAEPEDESIAWAALEAARRNIGS